MPRYKKEVTALVPAGVRFPIRMQATITSNFIFTRFRRKSQAENLNCCNLINPNTKLCTVKNILSAAPFAKEAHRAIFNRFSADQFVSHVADGFRELPNFRAQPGANVLIDRSDAEGSTPTPKNHSVRPSAAAWSCTDCKSAAESSATAKYRPSAVCTSTSSVDSPSPISRVS